MGSVIMSTSYILSPVVAFLQKCWFRHEASMLKYDKVHVCLKWLTFQGFALNFLRQLTYEQKSHRELEK